MADDDGGGNNGYDEVCKVYDKEDSFTSWVQIGLALLALGSLYIKRQQERPQRKLMTWFLDISKQAFGACYAHVLNMIVAAVLADNVRGDVQLGDECAWYAINYVMDCTLGLVLSIVFLRFLDYVANAFNWVSLKDSGVYHGKTGMLHWVNQLLAWVVILTVVKVIVCFVMWLISEPLAYIGAFCFLPFQNNIRFELLFVMIFFPGVMNIIYFWITDSYLKAKDHHKDAHEGGDSESVTSAMALAVARSFDFIDTGGVAENIGVLAVGRNVEQENDDVYRQTGNEGNFNTVAGGALSHSGAPGHSAGYTRPVVPEGGGWRGHGGSGQENQSPETELGTMC
jgi:hypothetical protein